MFSRCNFYFLELLLWPVRFCSFAFSGGDSSSSTTNNNYQWTDAHSDQSIRDWSTNPSGPLTDSNVVGGSGNHVNITSTDHGAVNAAFDFGNKSLGSAFDFGGKSLDFANQVASNAMASMSHSFSDNINSINQNTSAVLAKVTTDSGQQMQTLIKNVLIGGAVVVALIVFRK